MIYLMLIAIYLIGYVFAYRTIRPEITSKRWNKGNRIACLFLSLLSWFGVLLFTSDFMDWIDSKEDPANW